MSPETSPGNTNIEITTWRVFINSKNIVNNKIQTPNGTIEELQTELTVTFIYYTYWPTSFNRKRLFQSKVSKKIIAKKICYHNMRQSPKHQTNALKLSALWFPTPKPAEPVKNCHTRTFSKRRFRSRRSTVIYGQGQGTNDL